MITIRTPMRWYLIIACLAFFSLNTSAQNTTGLALEKGFTAKAVAENLGRARDLAITKNGDLYVKLARPKDGHSVLYLQDKNKDGVYEQVSGFGDYAGTGLLLKDNYLYTSSNSDVYRYKLDANQKVIDTNAPETIIKGLINRRQHETKSFTFDTNGNIYVNVGAYSNSCQVQDRRKESPGIKPCPVLDSAGGIWQFKADKQNQTYGDGTRFASGIRNVVGLDWNKQTQSLFVMQHGRDQLTMFPEYFDDQKSADLPAEVMFELKKGDNCGWPYIYYDGVQKKNVLAPEYGGDGKKESPEKYTLPVAVYPAHLAPNGLLFYTGSMFPEKYKNGAFIAFHGSWNRAPLPQEGFYVVFQPFKNGKPSGDWEIFADNFSGSKENTASGKAEHRPSSLAQGPDGALYVSDDKAGTIYKITFTR